MKTIYEAAGGFDGVLRLAHAWHARVLETSASTALTSTSASPGACR